jgi:hypothetical protein
MTIRPNPAVLGLDLALFTPNAWVDAAFYNVGCLSADELRMLAWLGKYHNEPPGTIVRVAPADKGNRARIKVVMAQDWHGHLDHSIDTVVVPGVGSSILGAAALAMDVADQTGKQVAGVVTGTGASGTIIDGLIGWYWYTPINKLDDSLISLAHDAAGAAQIDQGVVELARDAAGPRTPEEVLTHLLTLPNIVRVIAHSKGSLQLGPVVEAASDRLRQRAQHLKVGTLGAVIALPPCVDACQVLGELDWLGQLVSVPRAQHLLPGRSHSLNPNLPFGFGISLKDDVWGKFGADSAFGP